MSSLAELRAKIGALKLHSYSSWPCTRVQGGFPRGALVEISGHGKTSLVIDFLQENSQLKVAWIEKKISVFPTAILQRKVDLERILFVEAGKESAWTASTILRSQLFPILVYDAPYEKDKDLRRFQLQSERSGSTMILLREKPSLAWPISLHLESAATSVRITKRKTCV